MDEIEWLLQDQRLRRIIRISTMLEDSVLLASQSVRELLSEVSSMRTMTSHHLSPISYNHQEEGRLEGRS